MKTEKKTDLKKDLPNLSTLPDLEKSLWAHQKVVSIERNEVLICSLRLNDM